jgi:hypothetical protein
MINFFLCDIRGKKLSLCLTDYALRHVDVWKSESIDSHIRGQEVR